MSSMNRCRRCQGFVPANLSACPNCATSGRPGRAKAAWLMILGAGATAVTLAACYGLPPCDGADDCYPKDAGPGALDAHPRPCGDAGTEADGGCS